MKLLQLLYPGLGGHSSVAFSIIESDVVRRYNHHLVGYGIEAPTKSFLQKATENNAEVSNVIKEKGLDIISQKKIYKILQQQKPDYLIVHSTSLILVVFIYSLFCKTKWVMVEHQSNQAKSSMDWIYSLLIFVLAPRIVYLTQDYKGQMKKKFFWLLRERKVAVIPNGVNTNIFYPYADKSKKDEITFSMISRLNFLRDHKTLILAIKKIAENIKCKLLIAGDGDTKEELLALVKLNNLENVVFFTGTLEENEVVKLLHSTDIYIHSSLAETFSTSLLQVMACKIPIIATNINGINNLLEDGKDALLFTPYHQEELVEKIRMLIQNQNLQHIVVQECYDKILKYYSNSRLISNYIDFLDDRQK